MSATSSSSPMSPEDKVKFLLDSLEELRASLDEAISFIDDSAIQVDDRG